MIFECFCRPCFAIRDGATRREEKPSSPAGGGARRAVDLAAALDPVRVVTFSFLCPLLEKYGTFIARCNALIEKVSS
eukprot:SAG31_NODE_29530_length_393_cov_2.479592_1_plen_76_part_01